MLKAKVLDPITDEELEYMTCMHTPRCVIESYFHNFDNLGEFDEEKLGKLRPYQYNMISYEPFIDSKVPGLTPKQQFKLRKRVGDTFHFGARKYGKTQCVEKMDIMVSVIHCRGEQIGFSSTADEKITTVLDDVADGFSNHPFYEIYRPKINTAKSYSMRFNNGCRIIAINMNINSKKAGHRFHGKHYKRLYIEEASGETEAVFEARKESTSELGGVFRVAGMTNFVEASPAGKQFYALANKGKAIRYPQYINSACWDEEEKKDKIEYYGGEESFGYQVFVDAKILKDGIHEMDMQRVRPHYKKKSIVKSFELKKQNWHLYRSLLIVERPKQVENIYISCDIGDGRGGTEIIIHGQVGENFVYLYNITLYMLTDDEQQEIIKWLAHTLNANVIAMDCGDGCGRAIFRELAKTISEENLVWYAGNDEVVVDYERNEKGNVIYIKGVAQTKVEKMASWGFLHMRDMFYKGQIITGQNHKLDNQLQNVISIQSADGMRRRYMCNMENNHLFDAYRVFAIAVWQKFGLKVEKITSNWGTGSMGRKKTIQHDEPKEETPKQPIDNSWGRGSCGKRKERGV